MRACIRVGSLFSDWTNRINRAVLVEMFEDRPIRLRDVLPWRCASESPCDGWFAPGQVTFGTPVQARDEENHS